MELNKDYSLYEKENRNLFYIILEFIKIFIVVIYCYFYFLKDVLFSL